MTIAFLKKHPLVIAAALLIAAFFVMIPDLRSCNIMERDRERYRLRRADALIMALITLAYSAVAFYKLGNAESPETFAEMGAHTAEIELDINGGQVSHIMLFTGVGIGSYKIEYTTDGQDLFELAEFRQTHAEVLKWHDVSLDYYVTGGTIKISAAGNVWLGELVPLTAENGIVPATASKPALCDEQLLCPAKMTYMNSSYFDEVYHARTAWEHLNGIYPYEITHPPLGKTIIGIGIALFGMTPFGWRFSGTLFGVLMLPVLYVFAKKLFGGRAVPSACTMLMATDFMHYTQTRIATIDTYAVFFILLMYLFMYLFISEGSRKCLALSGVFFGLGAASKWTCIYAGAGLAVIWEMWVITEALHRRLDIKGFLRICGFCTAFFIIVPCIIYYLSYIPYGAAQGKPLFSNAYLRMVLNNQDYMFNYHMGVEASHPYSSCWYQWILDIRPILYYLEYLPDGSRSSFGAFVNPMLCWGGLLSLFALLYIAVSRRDRRAWFIIIGYLAQLVPWMFVSRVTFAYHYFPCTVFLILTLGYIFDLFRLNDRHWRGYVGGFVLASLALFVLFYPVLSGKPYADGSLLKWMPTWPF